jgi:hypothetical protein
MTLVRFAVSGLFLCSVPCFSQVYVSPAYVAPQHSHSLDHTAASPLKTRDFSAFKLSDPWRIAPSQAIELSSGMETLEENGMAKAKSEIDIRSSRETRDCFAIRSYLMARENKNSDATHLKAYSICQPSSQYQVKSATEQRVSRDR